MDNTFSIAIPDEMNEALNNAKDLIYPQLDTNQMITNLIKIGLQSYESNKEQENNDCMNENNQDLETNIIDLESNINKLELLSNHLRNNFCILDASTNPNAVLYFYNDATIQCNIIHDYIEKVKEISNNIQSLLIKTSD